MGKLIDHEFTTPIYVPPKEDIIDNLFTPAYSNSIRYDRCAGYFRSTIYDLTWQSMLAFIENNGKIRLICNHIVTEQDKEIILSSQEKIEKKIGENISEDIKDMMTNEDSKKYTAFLGFLLSNGYMEMRVCVPTKKHLNSVSSPKNIILHEKSGIFSDGENAIAFNGSANETYSALTGHREKISITRTWSQDPTIRKEVKISQDTFEDMWSLGENSDGRWLTLTFPQAARKELFKHKIANTEMKTELEKIDNKFIKDKKIKNESQTNKVELYKIPGERGINVWRENNYKAVLKYCTGSGKTRIAIAAIQIMLEQKKTPVIIVPGIPLCKQWARELAVNFPQVVERKPIIECHSDNYSYKKMLPKYTLPDQAGNAIILVLTKTAQTDFFKKHINAGKHNFLIADECHKLWAKGPNTILNLPWDDCPRLALSATPEERVNIFDTYEETEEIEDNPKVDVIKFFGGKNDNGKYTPNDIFTLHDAIEEGILKKYYYHIKFAYLTDNEVDDYLMVTKRLNKYMNIKFPTPEQRRRRDAAIFERLQIISVAEDKKRVVLDVIDGSKNKDDAVNLNDQNWVVYVGVGPVPKNEEGNPITSEKEIVKMEETLIEWRQKRKHFEIWPFHSSRSREELNNSLEKFTYLGGVLLANRMFDEGIDVPALSRGIIMASSSNEREFIQRRGRLLRKDKRRPNERAIIWDTIVLPPYQHHPVTGEDLFEKFNTHLKTELKRSQLFAIDSINGPTVQLNIENIASQYGVNLDE